MNPSIAHAVLRFCTTKILFENTKVKKYIFFLRNFHPFRCSGSTHFDALVQAYECHLRRKSLAVTNHSCTAFFTASSEENLQPCNASVSRAKK